MRKAPTNSGDRRCIVILLPTHAGSWQNAIFSYTGKMLEHDCHAHDFGPPSGDLSLTYIYVIFSHLECFCPGVIDIPWPGDDGAMAHPVRRNTSLQR
jgi:hypothetical protein